MNGRHAVGSSAAHGIASSAEHPTVGGGFGNAIRQRFDAGWSKPCGGKKLKRGGCAGRRLCASCTGFSACGLGRLRGGVAGLVVLILEVGLQRGPDGLAGRVANLVVEFVRQVDRYRWHGYDDVT